MTPEGKVKAKVKRILKPYSDDGSLWGDWPVPSGYGKSGLDYHGCSRGRYFAIETKAPGGKPTERQTRCAAQIERAGGTVFMIDGTDDEQYQQLKFWLDWEIANQNEWANHIAGNHDRSRQPTT